jgi:hypothetical protein
VQKHQDNINSFRSLFKEREDVFAVSITHKIFIFFGVRELCIAQTNAQTKNRKRVTFFATRKHTAFILYSPVPNIH